MDKIFIRPAKGGRISDPAVGEDLPPQGRWVDYSVYWAGKLAHGDVEKCDPPPEPEAEKAAAAEPDAVEPGTAVSGETEAGVTEPVSETADPGSQGFPAVNSADEPVALPDAPAAGLPGLELVSQKSKSKD